MKKEQQILIVSFVGLILFVYTFFRFIITPININISEIKKDIRNKELKLREAKLLSESLPKLQQETRLLELEIVNLEKKLPKETNLPLLLKIINLQAKNFGIRINSLTPQVIDTSAPQLKEIPFAINFSCNFHSLGQFLTELAQGERIIATRDLSITYSNSKEFPINGTCTILAFSLK